MRLCAPFKLRPLPLLAAVLTVTAVFVSVAFADAPPTANRPPAPPRVAPDRVTRALKRAVDFIYSQQNKAGHWDLDQPAGGWALGAKTYETNLIGNGPEYGGSTALAAFALLSAGEPADDPRLAKALAWLKSVHIYGIYAAGLRINALALVPSAANKAVMRQDVALLERSLIGPKSMSAGLYGYTEKATDGDHSASQFGVLGAWVASQHGLSPSPNYWTTVENAWLRDQLPSGGWRYRPDVSGDDTGSMTAAGLATLFIAQDFSRAGQGLDCRGNIASPAIDRGLAFLVDHFETRVNPRSNQPPFYYLFGLERVGVASGLRYIGPHDWYNEGAAALLDLQDTDGGYRENTLDTRVNATSFAVLFLARGNQPIVANKLRYSGPWNARPRDLANAARWFGRMYEREVNWQIVDLEADADDFHNAPVLYLAGSEKLAFTPEQRAKLKGYVDGGGLLLGAADCGKKAFADSFRALGRDMYPGYQFRVLPDDHLIRKAYGKIDQPLDVQGLSNGARELMVLIPTADPGRAWQMNKSADEDRKHEYLFQAAANVFLYASDPSLLRHANEAFFVRRDPTVKDGPRAKIARLRYAGNWDPEPGGWQRVARLLHNQYGVNLEVEAVDLGTGDLRGYRFAHLTGTDAIRLDDAARKQLKLFVARGGTLLVDAAGGSSAFATSIEQELGWLISGSFLSPLPIDDAVLREPVLAAPGAGTALPPSAPATLPATSPTTAPATVNDPQRGPLRVAWRRVSHLRLGQSPGLRLKGLRVGRRWGVVYSAEDLSTGLVGQNVDGIDGYMPATATEIVRRLLLNTLKVE